jgi:hypothetical protein
MTRPNQCAATAVVMRGLDPRIHVTPPLHLAYGEAWMAGTSPAMTVHF